MEIWMLGVVTAAIGVGFVLTRLWRSRGTTSMDMGEVSQSWITAQRAGKQRNEFAGRFARRREHAESELIIGDHINT